MVSGFFFVSPCRPPGFCKHVDSQLVCSRCEKMPKCPAAKNKMQHAIAPKTRRRRSVFTRKYWDFNGKKTTWGLLAFPSLIPPFFTIKTLPFPLFLIPLLVPFCLVSLLVVHWLEGIKFFWERLSHFVPSHWMSQRQQHFLNEEAHFFFLFATKMSHRFRSCPKVFPPCLPCPLYKDGQIPCSTASSFFLLKFCFIAKALT